MAERKAVVRFEEQGAEKVRRSLTDTADAAEKAGERSAKAAEKIGKTLGIALAAGATAAALMIKRAIDTGDALESMSQRTGVSVEELSRLDAVARLSDTSIEALNKGLGRLASIQLEAARGSKEQIAQLAAFGLTVAELEGLRPDEVLKRVADGFAGIEDPALRAALASKVFGKDLGSELLPVLVRGSQGINDLEKASDDLGYTMSTEAAQAASDLKKEMNLLGIGVDGIFRKVSQDLLPTLSELAVRFNDPQFREGFEAIITGAATAVIKVTELIGLLGNLAKFSGEELAARFGGPDATDTVRVEDRIARLKTTMNAVRDSSIFNPTAILDASELVPSDLLSTTETVLSRLQDELNKEENKLKVGLEINNEAALGAQGAAPGAASVPGSPDAAQAYLDALREQEEAEKAATAGRRAAAEAARAKAAAERELKRIMDEQIAAADEFQTSLEDLRAEMAGPVAQVNLEYERQVERLTELHAKGKVSQDDLTEALRLSTEARDRDVAAIEAQLTPSQEVLAQLREEIALLGMSTEAYDKYMARRAMGPDATDEELGEADRLVEQRAALERTAQGMDALRQSGKDVFMDWAKGSKGFFESLEDGLDGLRDRLLEMIAENLVEQLFGSFGSTDTGTAGGGFASFFSMLFGGATANANGNAFSAGARVEAFANGGVVSGPTIFPMRGGKVGLMGEVDDEAIMPLKRGRNGRLGVEVQGQAASTTNYNVQFVLPGRNDMRTESQRQADLARTTRMQSARSTA